MSSLRKLLLSLAAVMVLAGLSDFSLSAGKGGKPTTPKLTLTVSPSTIVEGNTATGTVTRNSTDLSSAVTVTLKSSDESEATVPEFVTIPENADSAPFTVTAVDDGLIDGSQTATVTATATGYQDGLINLTITDPATPPPLPPIAYDIQYFTAPDGGTLNTVNHMNDQGDCVGHFYTVDGLQHGFYYNALLDQPADLNDLATLPEELSGWMIASAVGLNNRGAIVGYVALQTNLQVRRGYVLDLSVTPAAFHLLPDESFGYTYARRINDNGDICGVLTLPDGTLRNYLYNPGLYGTGDVDFHIINVETTAPTTTEISNPPPDQTTVVFGYDGNSFFRYTPGTPIEWIEGTICPLESNETLYSWHLSGINDEGTVVGGFITSVPLKGKTKTAYTWHIFRYSDVVEIVAVGDDNMYPSISSINSDGDIALGGSAPSIFHDDWGIVDLDQLVSGTAGDLDLWLGGTPHIRRLGNRDTESGFGIAGGYEHVLVDAATNTSENRGFVLVPRALP